MVDVLEVFRKHGYTCSVEAFDKGTGPGTADCYGKALSREFDVTVTRG